MIIFIFTSVSLYLSIVFCSFPKWNSCFDYSFEKNLILRFCLDKPTFSEKLFKKVFG